MDKFLLDEYMVESIEYMRGQDGLSIYGIIKSINEESNSGLFNRHSEKILKYFNDFDEREDDENFMKCMLGHYEVKPEPKMNEFNNGIVLGEIMKQGVDLTKEEMIDVQSLLSELGYRKESLNAVKMLMQKVADSNYKLGAERQKEAWRSVIGEYIKTL